MPVAGSCKGYHFGLLSGSIKRDFCRRNGDLCFTEVFGLLTSRKREYGKGRNGQN